MKKPSIVILGAGYGGLTTAINLQKILGRNEADITLVNKNDYHYESTWLHEAAAGTLHHDRVRYPIESVIDTNAVNFVQDTVVKIIPSENKVLLEKGELTYDYLVVALGFESETFGIKGLKEHAFSIANVDAARKIRQHIEYQFATYNTELEKRDERLTLVVGGAGFTGIEFLGELANRVPELCQEYDIDPSIPRIYCIEAAPTALPGFDSQLVEYAVNVLERKGVEFKIGTAIKECTEEGILVSKGEETEMIKAGTVVWAAGVRGSYVVDESKLEGSIRGRVKVDPYLRVPNSKNVFVTGDCALLINEAINRPYPPTAQIAMQEGQCTARNLTTLIRGTEQDDLEIFVPDLKGAVCSLGHDDAIGIVFGKKIWGTKASFMKKMVDNRALHMMGGFSLAFKKGKMDLL